MNNYLKNQKNKSYKIANVRILQKQVKVEIHLIQSSQQRLKEERFKQQKLKEERFKQQRFKEERFKEENNFQTAKLIRNPHLKDLDEQEHRNEDTNLMAQKHAMIWRGTCAYLVKDRTRKIFFDYTKVGIVHGSKNKLVNIHGQPHVMVYDLKKEKCFYYVPKECLSPISPKKSPRSKRYKKLKDKLFPKNHKITVKDIKQLNLGDCYLQAALASIANTKPEYFKTMMRDDRDTVTVRLFKVSQDLFKVSQDLFKVSQDNDGKYHYTPQYIRVEKSIAVDTEGDELYNQGHLWVHMIQKAYLAGGFSRGKDKTENQNQNQTTNYKNIEGGLGIYPFQVLMGRDSTLIPTKHEEIYDNNADSAYYKIYDKLLDKNIEDNSLVTQSIKKICQQMSDKQRGHSAAVQITLEDIASAFERYGNDKEKANKDIILKELEPYFPGKLGSGKYSKAQLKIFSKIQQALLNKKPVTVGTYQYIQMEKTNSNKFRVWEKVDGLAGGHEYAVLSTCTSDDINKPEYKEDGKYQLIEMFNPWGDYGRKYVSDNNGGFVGKEKENSDGRFWVELSEFTKFFDSVSIGGQIPDR